ncbi:MAG: outer membrane lipoprotein carrier protein LolA [Rhodospirillaceae bacterium]
MKAPVLRWLCAALAALPLALPATPADAVIARTVKLSKEDIADLVRIEKSLNDIRTMQARFLQVSSDGDYAEGNIFLSRPGRMRIEYDPPKQIMVIADGSNLIYVDKELGQATAVLLVLTPAELILRANLSLIGDEILVTGFQRSPGVLRVSLVKANKPLEGQLTLVFSDKPLELRKWTVTDAQGIKTTVSLLGPRFGLALDKKLFDYQMPQDGLNPN